MGKVVQVMMRVLRAIQVMMVAMMMNVDEDDGDEDYTAGVHSGDPWLL